MESNTAPLLEMRGIKKDFFGNQVLTDINFTLKAGEVLGLAGENGAGKSTLLKLLLRFYDATGGTVRISGRDIRSYGLTELREKFGVVFQNDVIFKDSILENIRLRRDLTPEAVDKALKTAQAEEAAH